MKTPTGCSDDVRSGASSVTPWHHSPFQRLIWAVFMTLSVIPSGIAAPLPEMPPLRDIGETVEPPDVVGRWILIAKIVLSLLVTFIIAFVWWRSQRKAGTPGLALSAAAATQRKLNDLQVKAASMAPKELGEAVVETVRRYLQQDHGVLSSVKTTEELFPKKGPPPLPVVATFEALFRRCDQWRFGKVSPSMSERQSLVEEASRLVHQADQVPSPSAPLTSTPPPIPPSVTAEANEAVTISSLTDPFIPAALSLADAPLVSAENLPKAPAVGCPPAAIQNEATQEANEKAAVGRTLLSKAHQKLVKSPYRERQERRSSRVSVVKLPLALSHRHTCGKRAQGRQAVIRRSAIKSEPSRAETNCAVSGICKTESYVPLIQPPSRFPIPY